jgi:hypothetical protein
MIFFGTAKSKNSQKYLSEDELICQYFQIFRDFLRINSNYVLQIKNFFFENLLI